jgi:hypothetical protein
MNYNCWDGVAWRLDAVVYIHLKRVGPFQCLSLHFTTYRTYVDPTEAYLTSSLRVFPVLARIEGATNLVVSF